MHVVAEVRIGVDGVDDGLDEIARMRGGEADAADAGDVADVVEQGGEIPAGGRGVAIAVDVLAQQLNFGIAGVGEAAGFVQDAGAGAAALRSAGEGDDAVGAGFCRSLR